MRIDPGGQGIGDGAAVDIRGNRKDALIAVAVIRMTGLMRLMSFAGIALIRMFFHDLGSFLAILM